MYNADFRSGLAQNVRHMRSSALLLSLDYFDASQHQSLDATIMCSLRSLLLSSPPQPHLPLLRAAGVHPQASTALGEVGAP
jgi:hypothetical protein